MSQTGKSFTSPENAREKVNGSDNPWYKRAVKYDKLFWTKDEGYLDAILEMGDFQKDDLALDVGIGTGAVAKRIRPHVRHVIGVDIAEPMLKRGQWEDISIVKWDIREALFVDGVFDKIVARMVFHHIVDNIELAFERCHRMLKEGGKMIVAEGVPPTDDPYVIHWYTDMFKLKEERRTFTKGDLVRRLEQAGFKEIETREYPMRGFSIRNWLVNSGLDQQTREKIMEKHLLADERIREAYCMRSVDGDCLVDTRNVILGARKKSA